MPDENDSCNLMDTSRKSGNNTSKHKHKLYLACVHLNMWKILCEIWQGWRTAWQGELIEALQKQIVCQCLSIGFIELRRLVLYGKHYVMKLTLKEDEMNDMSVTSWLSAVHGHLMRIFPTTKLAVGFAIWLLWVNSG